MERSESIIELTKALALFHIKVGKIKKDANNPFFKSNYASLSNILEEVNIPLSESGLVIAQFPDGVGLVSMLIHAESSQFISSNYHMPVAKQNDPQALGSAISYARRYAITSILSLNVEDDDGNKASEKPKDQSPKNQESKKENDLPWLNTSTEQWDKVVISLKGNFTLPQVKMKYKISKINEQKLLNEASE